MLSALCFAVCWVSASLSSCKLKKKPRPQRWCSAQFSTVMRARAATAVLHRRWLGRQHMRSYSVLCACVQATLSLLMILMKICIAYIFCCRISSYPSLSALLNEKQGVRSQTTLKLGREKTQGHFALVSTSNPTYSTARPGCFVSSFVSHTPCGWDAAYTQEGHGSKKPWSVPQAIHRISL